MAEGHGPAYNQAAISAAVAYNAATKTRPHRFSLRFCNLVMPTKTHAYYCCSFCGASAET
jgi:hypothetical protein